MGFIAAISHAIIHYGIRRKGWPEGIFLTLDVHQLKWAQDFDKDGNRASWNKVYELTQEDVRANDWEAP